MSTKPLNNPFVIGHYVSDEYFCDREEETRFLMKQVENGRNTVLISPRRMGKSGLIHHLFNQKDVVENFHTFFIDIYATNSLSELVYQFGKEIYQKLKPKSKVYTEKFFQIISSFRVGFKMDAISGEPGFDISLGDIHQPEVTLQEIFQYLQEADMPCIIAIDEFQQINNYEEKNVEALLRTYIQKCSNALFIFSGSKRHVMANMFSSPAKPFYQSAISMSLDPIPSSTYVGFANGLFQRYGKSIEKPLIEKVYEQYDGITWFIQMMMNELFSLTPSKGHCTEDLIDEAERNVIQTQRFSYHSTLEGLSLKQRQLLYAIAKTGKVQGLTSSAFIRANKLPSASSVQSAAKVLLEDDIITNENGTYRIYDAFFAKWLRDEIKI